MNTLKIHGLTTGHIQVKTGFLRPEPKNVLGNLLSLVQPTYTEPLPVWCWVIEHPLGLTLVDTGMNEQAAQNWFGRTQTRIHFRPENRLTVQIEGAGLNPADVTTVIFTHLHIDHDRAAGDFPQARLLVSARELRDYLGNTARLLGYSPPTWRHAPQPVYFAPSLVGPFSASFDVFGDGRLLLLPTPGHTPGHLSVLIRQPEKDVLLAGDLTYSQADLQRGRLGGFLFHPGPHRRSMYKVRQLAQQKPLIYLPSHDPESLARLQAGAAL